MRPRMLQRREVTFAIDTAIGLALVCTVTFFLLVIEFCVGHGELTHAELLVLAARRMTHLDTPNQKHPTGVPRSLP
jgi:hypothetical protein